LNQKKWLKVIMISGGHFWVDFYVNIFTAILPIYAYLYGWNKKDIAFILAIQSITVNFGQPVFGYLLDTFPRASSLIKALLWIAIPCILLSYTSQYYLIMLVAFLAGVGSAIYHPLGIIKISEVATDNKGLIYSIYATVGNLGFSLSPVIIVWFMNRFGIEKIWLFLIPILIWIILLRLTKSDNHTITTSKKGSLLVLKDKNLLLIILITTLRCWAFFATIIFMPLYMLQGSDIEKYSGLVQTVFLLATTVGSILGGIMVDKINNQRKILLYSLLLAGFFMQLLLNSQGLITWFLLIIFGIVLHLNFPLTILLVQKMLPTNAGFAAGIMMGLSFGLGSFAATYSGWLADTTNLGLAMKITTLFLFPAALLSTRIHLKDLKETVILET